MSIRGPLPRFLFRERPHTGVSRREWAWLGAIAAQLLTDSRYRDIAVRDAVMALGAITLAKLTEATAERREPMRPRERTRYEPLYATD